MKTMRLRVAGETLELHAERAIHWPRRNCLFVADVHFGKGSVLRRAGVNLPTGQTSGDLARLDDSRWAGDVRTWGEIRAAG